MSPQCRNGFCLFDVNRASGDIYGINDISPRFLETVKLLKMKSIQVIASLLCGILYCGISLNAQNVLKATGWMPEHTFTSGIEGPAVDSEGNLYAVNYKKEGTIGIVRPDGSHGCFLVLPEGSTGNSIRFGKDGNMYVADYTGHNILKVDMKSKKISVFAHEPKMNQPNDIVFAPNGNMYASDPDWPNQKGQLWLITPDAKVSLLETNMGTTNGIAVSEDGKRLYVNESAQLKSGYMIYARMVL